MRLNLPCLLILALVPTGCMVGPDFAKPDIPIENKWIYEENPTIKTETADYHEWWAVFNDPILNTLIEKASQQNLDLEIAGLRIFEARAQLGISIGLLFPQSQQARAGALINQFSKNSPLVGALDHFNYNYAIGFDAAWELDFWGRFRRGVESASASLYSALANYDDLLVTLTAEVARTYIQIRTIEQRIVFAKKNILFQQQSQKIAIDRYEGGETSELDVTQATSLLKQTQATVPNLEAILRQTKNALAVLLGIQPIAVQSLLGSAKPIPVPPTDVAVGVPAELLHRRPDIRRAEFQAAAQSARIGIAKSDLFPQLSLAGTFSFVTSHNGGFFANNADFVDLFSSNSILYSVGPQVRWPILNYGRIKNDVRAQDARFQQFLVEYRNTILRAIQEVEDGMVGFLKAKEERALIHESVKQYERSVELSLLRYTEGLSPYQSVIDSQRFLTQQQDLLALTTGAVAANLIATYKALGGGWERRKNQSLISPEVQEQMLQRTDWGNYFQKETFDSEQQKQ
ncbi:MAG: efflux transporter outer membrane subunit [Nitrospirales bacterium]|nr:efflux transporter outer membrane subunit [Nitrospira sp.]MDR4501627.1 efflux transporter outer membrane subunit [Nitrospirales bacterium]